MSKQLSLPNEDAALIERASHVLLILGKFEKLNPFIFICGGILMYRHSLNRYLLALEP